MPSRRTPAAPPPAPAPGVRPLLPARRVRRPGDLVRCAAGLLALVLVLLMAGYARNTTAGLGSDLPVGGRQGPGPFASAIGFLSGAGVLLVPLAFAVDRLVRRDGARVADGVLAAVLAYALSLGLNTWVTDGASTAVRAALTNVPEGGTPTDAVHVYLAPVIACMTAAGLTGRPRSRLALWAGVVLCGTTALLGGYATVLSLTLTVLLGFVAGHGTLWTIGAPADRTTARHVAAGLATVGITATAVRPETDPVRGGRRHLVHRADGPPLDVHVLDREQQASGFFYRLWRRLRLRSFAVRRTPQSVHQALEQEALLAYAATASGARTPELLAATELGPDTALLVYTHVPGRTLDELAEDEIDDALLRSWWECVHTLHRRRVSHGRLTGRCLLAATPGPGTPETADPRAQGHLLDLTEGSIAAGDLALRLDVAHLLTVLALRVGADRATASATAVLGVTRVSAALPLLQPIGLLRSVRRDLRRHDRARKSALRTDVAGRLAAGELTQAEAERELGAGETDLLAEIRARVLAEAPRAEAEPVRLERLRPRTLFSVVAGAFAVYLLCTQLTVRPSDIVARAAPGWALAALAAAALSHVAAAMSLTGFVPEKLRFGRSVAAQLAGSFVKLVAPAAVGGVALNTRFLQRSGLRPVQAAASVGASQLVGLGCHILLLAGFGYVAGNERTQDLTPSRSVIAGLLTGAVLVLAIGSVGPVRRRLLSLLRPLLTGVVPRMLDLVQRPGKLATGFGGTILLTLCNVACLTLSVRAFGGQVSFAVAAVVFLAGNAVGSAAPIPGGIGTIEVALAAGLRAAAGLDYTTAYLAVLLFRLLTFWLPVLPGWLAFTVLQRKKAL
ncbi:lysylphosphatidylglycerol synthase domain-containing protein [Streptomyces sp. NPDC007088]|uniref:lysylphosphatidylglycerol synthase domain-containing protein n=1 Tax=Streptomyces sp. NPDC007088 TaxID=3364773 RepID=UPI0036BBFBF9